MSRYAYQVLAFRQQEQSPIQVAFVAHAADILEWSGVPRKSDELLTGYQRFRDLRRIDQDIVPFFQNPQNCSPTAVIVALRKNAGLASCTLENVDRLRAGEIATATLRIEVADDMAVGDRVFLAALEYVNTRLGI